MITRVRRTLLILAAAAVLIAVATSVAAHAGGLRRNGWDECRDAPAADRWLG